MTQEYKRLRKQMNAGENAYFDRFMALFQMKNKLAEVPIKISLIMLLRFKEQLVDRAKNEGVPLDILAARLTEAEKLAQEKKKGETPDGDVKPSN